MENLGSYDSGVPFRKFIFVFLLVCIVVGTGVFYSAFSRVSVTLIPVNSIKEVATEITVDAGGTVPDTEKGLLAGEIKSREAEGTEKGITVDFKKIDEVAKGRVTIRNTTPYIQGIKQGATLKPIDAPDDVLFVTVNRVTLPPKGSREVDIVAAFKGAKGNLPQGKFQFVNLDNAYMRDNILVDSKGKIEGGIREAKIVTQEDLDRAHGELGKKMFKKALEEINKDMGPGKIVKEDSAKFTIMERTATAVVGQEVESFDISLKIDISGVTLDENELKSIAEKKVRSLGDTHEEFGDFEDNSFSYALTNLDLANKKATLTVKIKGRFNAKLSAKVFDKEEIVGYNEKAVREHFDKYDNIKDVKINFWPSFRKTVPNIESRIDISVKTEKP